MDPQAAKMIGAGIACIGMGGAGVGVGTIFGHYLAAALRNPSAAQGQFGNLIFGFAVTEALGIFSLLIALLLLFALYHPSIDPDRGPSYARGAMFGVWRWLRRVRSPLRRSSTFLGASAVKDFLPSMRTPLRPNCSGSCWPSSRFIC